MAYKLNRTRDSMGNNETKAGGVALEKQHRHVLTSSVTAKPPNKTAFTKLLPLPDRDLDLP